MSPAGQQLQYVLSYQKTSMLSSAPSRCSTFPSRDALSLLRNSESLGCLSASSHSPSRLDLTSYHFADHYSHPAAGTADSAPSLEDDAATLDDSYGSANDWQRS